MTACRQSVPALVMGEALQGPRCCCLGAPHSLAWMLQAQLVLDEELSRSQQEFEHTVSEVER